MFSKLFKKKEKLPEINLNRKVCCPFVNEGKTSISIAEVIDRHDTNNVMCRSCRECEY